MGAGFLGSVYVLREGIGNGEMEVLGGKGGF